MLIDAIDDQDIRIELEPALLIDDAGEIPCLAVLRRTTAQMVKEALICNVKAFQYLLGRLAVQEPSSDTLRKMRLHPCAGDILPIQGIVPLLQREGMVPNKASLTQHRVQLRRPLCPIELVCVCHHILKSFDLLQI